MSDLFALAAVLLPLLEMPTFLDLAKIFGVPVALALLARHLTRRDKRRDETLAEETRALKTRSETAEQERTLLRTDAEKNKSEHDRFTHALQDMRSTIQLIQNDVQALKMTFQNDVQALKMNAAGAAARSEATKETLDRVHIQLGRLIDNYRSLS